MRLFVLAMAVVAAFACAAPAAERKPNIIYIMVDDAGVGDYTLYAKDSPIRTPRLEQMAEEGMMFTNAYSGSAVCGPTRCVLMTGTHSGHCIRRANRSRSHGLLALEPNTTTVASYLKKAGYATAGFGKWGLGNPGTTGVPEKQGFDLWYGCYDQRHAHDYYTDYMVRNSKNETIAGNTGGKKQTYVHDLMVDEMLKFIRENKDRPFFVYGAWLLPHGKYVIPSDDPALEHYRDKPWSRSVKNYAAMITKADTDLGRVIDLIKELGLDDNTIIVFNSDNGTNGPFVKPLGSNGGLRGVKRSLYEGGIRMPSVARWPGKIKPGTSSDLLNSHVDLLATAAEIAGLPEPKGHDGISIVPTLLGKPQPNADRHLYWEIYEGPHPFQQAVRVGKWKGYRTATKAPLELYDLSNDPAEQDNVAAKHPDVVKKIEAIMAAEHTPTPYFVTPEQPRARKKAKPG